MATSSSARKSSPSKASSSRKAASSKRTSSSSAAKEPTAPKEVTDGGAIADARAAAGHRTSGGVQGGIVDNMTRRSAADVQEGHFCTIDRTHAGISDDVQEMLGGRDGYGVYTEPGEVDEKGFPKTAVVLLRDSSSARVVVPYDALSPVDVTERRS